MKEWNFNNQKFTLWIFVKKKPGGIKWNISFVGYIVKCQTDSAGCVEIF